MTLILSLIAAGGWCGALVFGVLWLRAARPKVYLSHGEAIAKRVTMLRKGAFRLMEESDRQAVNGYLHSAKIQREHAEELFAEADRLDPPVPPGGEPGRLSLVKDGEP
jgi:hypothetical protein